MSTRPGSTFEAMASTSLGPVELDEPELPLAELPEPPKAPPNGEPLPKWFPAPEPPPFPEGTRELPDAGARAWVLGPLFVVAWPMPMPAPRTAIAAAPARRPLRTRGWVLPAAAAGAADHVGAPGWGGGGPPSGAAGASPSMGLPARAPMAYVPWGGVVPEP